MTALVPTPERLELREAVRKSLQRHPGPRGFLAEQPSGKWFDASLLEDLNRQLGLAELLVPIGCGGAGGQLADAAIVFEELGAALAPVPLFATVALATSALVASGGEAAATLLGRIARGEATVALADARCGLPDDHRFVAVPRAGGGWLVSGRSGVVIEGAGADVLLVTAETGDGVTLFAVEADASGVQRRPLRTLDLTRGIAEVVLDGARAEQTGASGGGRAAADLAWDVGSVLLAAEQVGGAQRVLDTAVEYAKQRVQFDQKIGSFQQISSKLVDLLLDVEMARSALATAVDAADEHWEDRGEDTRLALLREASLAKALCSDSYMHVADEGLHVVGGIGFTWEHDAHLYFRRAKSTQQLLGSPDSHRERLAKAAGL
ncbi:acyl-CoA dehydrogenase family protein [Arthrobacter sp. I2-34]|uniref:Acyl-CoA dehydrogenase family protein n=1 Tax=Arthrobacter hankyongi TaxID=2904801 RepID=A0ABS9L3K6_9MICC|nr:acyl-CoA dehydrogenase family protein [Arthrobacter hankyongi]MCG2621234.1 acyl-CoA dehydrogenase family protein [Arthrobacter hankyongi]